MDSTELKNFSRQASDQLFNHILPFWCGPALDREQGGWMGWLSNDLKPDRTQPKGLIVNSRLLWTFSAVHQARPEKLFRQMADRAFDYVMNRFWDTEYGGVYWLLDDTGRVVVDDSKKCYGQAFHIYALSEYYRAFGAPAALARAREQFELLERHAHDARFGGYLEVCRRDWSEADASARLSDKDMSEKKSMNNHLHVLEAYSNLYRIWKEPRVEERLREILRLFEEHILDSRKQHLNHFFNEAWQVHSDTYTFGHDIEATWLMCEAAELLKDAHLLEHVRGLALRMADVTLQEGIEADGGLCYEGKAGKIVDHGKEWWPQAEAMIGFLNAFQISKETKYLDAARRVWDFIEQHLVDRVHGDWFWRITPEGQVDDSLPKVSQWKEPYHGVRACLEASQRLKKISAW